MDKGTIRSKFLGSLIGTGVGDALGAGLEGHRTVDEAVVRTLAEKSVPLVYTDDTHMMIGVAESLARLRAGAAPGVQMDTGRSGMG